MPTLTLSMIVRDAAHDLPACLESVRGVVNEIVVADTGSTDATIEVARSFGARVVSIPWEQDFAKARNHSLAEVHSDWVLALDADEQLDPAGAARLPALLAAGNVFGYQVTIRNYLRSLQERLWDQAARPNDPAQAPPAARCYPAYVEHHNVRLFRRDPEIYFVHRVHESVGPRIEATGRKLGKAGFLIHHFGLAADAETRAGKNRLYRELGRAKVREKPRDAQAHFELGLEEFENFGNFTEALGCFEQAVRLNPRLQVAWLFAGLANLRLGRDAQALEYLAQARHRYHDSAVLAEAEGDAHFNLGHCEVARRAYRRSLQLDSGSPIVESKLGLTEVRLGRAAAGLQYLTRAIERTPDLGHLYDRLIAAAVSLNRLEDAALAAECKLVNAEPDPDSFLRAAALRARLGDQDRCAELLRIGAARFPDAGKLRQGLLETTEAGVAGALRAGSAPAPVLSS